MKVSVVVKSPSDDMPIQGPDRMAWNIILDAIFADAFHAGVRELAFFLPFHELAADVELRGELTISELGSETALVCTFPEAIPVVDFDRLYMIDHGGLRLRKRERTKWIVQHALQPVKQYWVYTWRSRMQGIPIRLAGMLKRPDLVDGAMYRMRLGFVSERATWSYYRLSVLAKSGDTGRKGG
ncbi:MAG: hypothetical protein ACYCVB_03885 [Bacilli bacterium]